ncbi:MAG: 2-dehydro-3-deoxygalactonokinase [Acidobacteriota bacterium]
MNYLALDSGTTNSRLWLMQGSEVKVRKLISVGVRNTAFDGHNRALVEAIAAEIKRLQTEDKAFPRMVVSAGMITSSLGLHEVRHVQAPAGIDELAAQIETRSFPEVGPIPFYFLPGVRSGPMSCALGGAGSIDIIRGEETEVIGSSIQLGLHGPLLYIHLGSHTKMIHVDAEDRICGGASTLGGELTLAVKQNTILRDALPDSPPRPEDAPWLEEGWQACRRLGLSRTLYMVRVYHLHATVSKESLIAFQTGAILSEEFRCLEELLDRQSLTHIVLSGLPQLHWAWCYFLDRQGLPVRCLSGEETERAFLTGLLEIFGRSRYAS